MCLDESFFFKAHVQEFRLFVCACACVRARACVPPDQIGRNPGLQGIWEDEKQRRRQNNQESQIEAPESQGEQQLPVSWLELRPFPSPPFFLLLLTRQPLTLSCTQSKMGNFTRLLSVPDRGFIPATESESIFMKRLKDLLKQNDFDV